ncbi:hypothetical protein DAG40_09320 [Campylobacter coli]|nr:hypothetical protein [Campylobacter coli]EAL2698843.1 hypothetical protein [Campylobacter coli]
MNKVSEVKKVTRVFQGKSVYDCFVRWNDTNKFVPCTVDIQNPGDLKSLADYLLKHNLINGL